MKIIRGPLTATMCWGLPNLCLQKKKTAVSYFNLGATQNMFKDYALGEDHENTADSYHELGLTHDVLRDYTSATKPQKLTATISWGLSSI